MTLSTQKFATGPTPKPSVLEIAPYVGTRVGPNAVRHQLSSNESAIGPSPAAVTAYRAAAAEIQFYPEGGARELREAIGAMHGLDPDCIVCGNGSDELLPLIAHA